eukprot:2005745-Prymnesium_polylepis.1
MRSPPVPCISLLQVLLIATRPYRAGTIKWPLAYGAPESGTRALRGSAVPLARDRWHHKVPCSARGAWLGTPELGEGRYSELLVDVLERRRLLVL